MNQPLPERRVASKASIRIVKRLPIDGEVLVSVGDWLQPNHILARARLPEESVTVPVGRLLGMRGGDLKRYLLKQVGDTVREGEPLAMRKLFPGFGKRLCYAPVEGIVVRLADSGEVVIQPSPREIEIRTYVGGRVVNTLSGRGAVIEVTAAYVQGMAGYGKDVYGPIKIAVGGPDEAIEVAAIDDSCHAIVIGGTIGVEVISRAAEVGVAGIVVGGLSGRTYRWLVENAQPLTVIVTEGFGCRQMSALSFNLFRSYEGRMATLSAGVQGELAACLPEVIIPLLDSKEAEVLTSLSLEPGRTVCLTDGARLGMVGRITTLLERPVRIESGIVAKLVEVELEDGHKAYVAWRNIELLA
ncbi:MAG: hypothetical protein M1136_05360 [Chloroflexi bacterium]|nr:hypothetical protein [Chloroflexota bacterium]MCL5075065.1 hypothetical protein [Chloroflexota bacterium]